MERKLISVSGPDTHDFLQGLVTNDLDRADADGIAYAAMLTPQGKYLFDFFILPWQDGYLLDVAADQAPALMQRLGMYKLRSAVEIAVAEGVQVSRGTGEAPDGALADPRDASLGWRFYGADKLPDDGTDWDALRVAGLIPETGVELISNSSYILEQGFDRLNGVAFRKGCYVGQEVTSRMRHKTVLRKGLARVRIAGKVAPGTAITRDGREVGQIFTQSEGHAIAYLRFDRVGAGMEADGIPVTAEAPVAEQG